MTVNLPKTNQTGKNEWADVEDNDVALRSAIESLQTEVAAISGVTWYTPKAIATEETRESTSFGTLTTADEIKSVVLPENGLIMVGYRANWKQGAGGEVLKGRAAIFLGANQLKFAESGQPAPIVQEASTVTPLSKFGPLTSATHGLMSIYSAAVTYSGDVTTGQALAQRSEGGTYYAGMCPIFAAAGTYDISVRFKATSGSVTAKNRVLQVAVLG
jgi:hypothetical protein